MNGNSEIMAALLGKGFRNRTPPAGARAATGRVQCSLGNDGVLELMIYGDIVDAASISYLEAWGYSTAGFVSAVMVRAALDDSAGCSKIRVRINSPGGDAYEGVAIHSLLTSQGKPVEVCVDGIAASAASVIAMAGSTRIMGRSAMMMIHDAWAGCVGNSRDMRKMADALDTIDESIAAAYVDRTGMTQEAIRAMMDEETWLSAQNCVDQGFATGIVEPPAAEEEAAMAMARGFGVLARLKNVPEQLRAKPAAAAPPAAVPTAADAAASDEDECNCQCEQCEAGNCDQCSNAECDDPNCSGCPMQAEASAQAAWKDQAKARQRQRERELQLKKS